MPHVFDTHTEKNVLFCFDRCFREVLEIKKELFITGKNFFVKGKSKLHKVLYNKPRVTVTNKFYSTFGEDQVGFEEGKV